MIKKIRILIFLLHGNSRNGQLKMRRKQDTCRMKEVFLKALNENKGLVTYACQKTNVARQTHYLWLTTDEEYAKRVAEIRETVLDFGENQLLKNISEGKEASLLFFLKCQGKSRGYIEKKEIELTTKDDSVTSKRIEDMLIDKSANNEVKNA